MNLYFYMGQRLIGQVDFDKMKFVPRVGEQICMDFQEGYEDSRLVIFDVVSVRMTVPNEIIVGRDPILVNSGVNIGLKMKKGVDE